MTRTGTPNRSKNVAAGVNAQLAVIARKAFNASLERTQGDELDELERKAAAWIAVVDAIRKAME